MSLVSDPTPPAHQLNSSPHLGTGKKIYFGFWARKRQPSFAPAHSTQRVESGQQLCERVNESQKGRDTPTLRLLENARVVVVVLSESKASEFVYFSRHNVIIVRTCK